MFRRQTKTKYIGKGRVKIRNEHYSLEYANSVILPLGSILGKGRKKAGRKGSKKMQFRTFIFNSDTPTLLLSKLCQIYT